MLNAQCSVPPCRLTSNTFNGTARCERQNTVLSINIARRVRSRTILICIQEVPTSILETPKVLTFSWSSSVTSCKRRDSNIDQTASFHTPFNSSSQRIQHSFHYMYLNPVSCNSYPSSYSDSTFTINHFASCERWQVRMTRVEEKGEFSYIFNTTGLLHTIRVVTLKI